MLILLLLMFITLFVLFSMLLKIYAEKVFQLMTETRHKEADFILNTEHAPEEWRYKMPYKMGLAFSDKHAHKMALKRIDTLSAYFMKTPLVDSEQTRKIILGKFSLLKKKWASMTWEELFPARTNKMD